MSDLAHRTIKNSFYSFIGYVWPLALSFIAMPILIRGLGTDNYGLYVIINSLMSIIGLLDFGMSYTFFKKLSENPDKPDYDSLSKTFSLTFWYYLLIGIISFLIVVLTYYLYICHKNEIYLDTRFLILFYLIGITIFIKSVSVPFQNILFSLQKIDISSKISLVLITFTQLGNVILILFGYNLLAVFIIQAVATFFSFFLYCFFWKKYTPKLKVIIYISLREYLKLFKNGLMIFISNFMNNIIAQLDKFIVGMFSGISAVSFYSTSEMITDKIHTASLSFSSVLTPVFSSVSHPTHNERRAIIFRKSIKLITLVSFSVAVAIFVFADKFIYYWINPEFAEKCGFAIRILVFTYFNLAIFGFIYSFLVGVKALKFAVISTSVMALLDIIFMFILIPKYGFNGAAIAYLISTMPVFYYLYYIENNYFKVSSKLEIIYFYVKIFLKLFFCGCISGGLGFFLLSYVQNIWLVIISSIVIFFVDIMLYKLFNFFDKEDWNLLKNFFINVVKGKLQLINVIK